MSTRQAICDMSDDELATMLALADNDDIVKEIMSVEEYDALNEACQKSMMEKFKATDTWPEFDTWIGFRAEHIRRILSSNVERTDSP